MVVRVILGLMVVCVLAIAGLTAMVVFGGSGSGTGSGSGSTSGSSSSVAGEAEAAANLSARAAALAELQVPEFILVDQDGTMQNQTIFEDGFTVLTTVFTNCPFACPLIMEQTVRVQDATEGTGLRFVSMSVDPEHDTPTVLKAFAERKGVDESRWRLLTGPKGTVQQLAETGLKMYIGVDPDQMIPLADGTEMANVVHPTKLILIGPDRRVVDLFESGNANDVDRLIRMAPTLRVPAGG